MKIRSKICEIQYLAMLCKEQNYHCFTEFSAHVNMFNIRLYNGKWTSDKGSIRAEFSVTDSEYALGKADSVIYQLKSILKKEKIDYSELMEIERIEIDYRF